MVQEAKEEREGRRAGLGKCNDNLYNEQVRAQWKVQLAATPIRNTGSVPAKTAVAHLGPNKTPTG